MANMLTELDRALSRSCSISEKPAFRGDDAIHHSTPVRESYASGVADSVALCDSTEPSPRTGKALTCTLNRGHSGPHVAHGLSGDALHTWGVPAESRRMVAVTVALSEPADSPELDWPATIAANLRLLYGHTSVEIIDTWRNDA